MHYWHPYDPSHDHAGKGADHVCSTIDEPTNWRHSLNRRVPETYAEKGVLEDADYKDKIIKAMWHGVVMFRNATIPTSPRKFCWETGRVDRENKANASIHFGFRNSTLYVHPERVPKTKITVVVVSGSGTRTYRYACLESIL